MVDVERRRSSASFAITNQVLPGTMKILVAVGEVAEEENEDHRRRHQFTLLIFKLTWTSPARTFRNFQVILLLIVLTSYSSWPSIVEEEG